MIKSQDDLNKCNDGKRSSEVLIKTIEKCERLKTLVKYLTDLNDDCIFSIENANSVFEWLVTVITPEQREIVEQMLSMNKELLAKLKQIKELEK